MIKACIFDLDGTLGDTRRSLIHSVGLTLREMGLPAITDEQCISFVGNGARVLMEKSLAASGEGNEARIAEGMEIYGRVFDENCTYEVYPYDGVMDVLKSMKEKGIKLAVLSNKPHRQTVKVVEAMYGRDTFTYIQGQQDGLPRKPAPEAVYYVADKLGVLREECLYVGDSEVDAATGRGAGVKTVCVSWGFRTREELKAADAEYIIERAQELLEFV